MKKDTRNNYGAPNTEAYHTPLTFSFSHFSFIFKVRQLKDMEIIAVMYAI